MASSHYGNVAALCTMPVALAQPQLPAHGDPPDMPAPPNPPEDLTDMAALPNSAYLAELDSLQISKDIHRGLGISSVSAAHRGWVRLTRDLERLGQEQKEVLNKSGMKSWTGSAATKMQTATSQFDDYLSHMLDAALKRRDCCSSIIQAFLSTQYDVVAPEIMEKNRNNAAILRQSALPELLEIADLDSRYQEYEAKNQRALQCYHHTVSNIMQRLPPLPEAPLLNAKLLDESPQLDISEQFSQWWNTVADTAKDVTGTVAQRFLEWWRQLCSYISEAFSAAPTEPLSYELTEVDAVDR